MEPPDQAPDHLGLARRLLASGAVADARRMVRRGLALQPGSAAALALAGRIAFRGAAMQEALDLFRRTAVVDQHRDPLALLNLAQAEQRTGRLGEARATAGRAAVLFPDDHRPRVLLALLMAETDGPEAAARQLRPGDIAALDPATAQKVAAATNTAGRRPGPDAEVSDQAASGPPQAVEVEDGLRDLIGMSAPDDPRRYRAVRRILVQHPAAAGAFDAIDPVLRHRGEPGRRAAWAWRASCADPGNRGRLEHAAELTYEARLAAHGIAANRMLLRQMPGEFTVIWRIARLYPGAGNGSEAVAWGREILAGEPDDPRIWGVVAEMLGKLGEADASAEAWRQTIRRFPLRESLYYNLGGQLDGANRLAASRRAQRRALLIKPDYIKAANRLGMVHAAEHDVGRAIRYVRWALAVDPLYPKGRMNLGAYLRTAGAYGASIEALQAAESVAGDDRNVAASSRYNRGIVNLLIGELAQGFNLIEARWATEGFPSPKRSFAQRIWPGPRAAPGSRLLLYMEQGMGDEIMLSWYIPLLRRDTARLVVDCDRRLVDLFARTYEGVEFVPASADGDPKAHDPDLRFKVPALHVPQYYVPELRSVLAENWRWSARGGTRFPSRLVHEPARLARWRRWMDERFAGRPRVAVSWRSAKHSRVRDIQYLTVEEIASAIPPGCVAVNLQYSSTAEETAELQQIGRRRGFEFVTPEGVDLTDDLEDVLAILENADAAVTPLISLAWMAGAVGCPAYVFRSTAERRMWHQLGTAFIPWAPSLKVFFRHPTESWDATIADLRSGLAAFLSPHG